MMGSVFAEPFFFAQNLGSICNKATLFRSSECIQQLNNLQCEK